MENKQKFIWFLIFLIIILVVGYRLWSVNKQTQEEGVSRQEEISKRDIIATNLASKYQATTAGEEDLTYTLQAQERFITGKPILFTNAYVDDVFNRDGKTFIRFWSSWFSHKNYVLEVECSKDIVDKVLAQKGGNDSYGLDGEYAVVANIQEVTKPVFALEGSVISEDDPVEINMQPSDLFIAKGVCVDVAYISNGK
jgi:hypothetical protein